MAMSEKKCEVCKTKPAGEFYFLHDGEQTHPCSDCMNFLRASHKEWVSLRVASIVEPIGEDCPDSSVD